MSMENLESTKTMDATESTKTMDAIETAKTVDGMETTKITESMETSVLNNAPVKKAFNKKLLIPIFCGAIVLISAVVAAVTMLSAKPARSFYLETEGRNFIKYSNQIKNSYKEFYSGQEPFISGTYKSRYEAAVDITTENKEAFGLKNIQSILDIVRKFKLVVEYNNNTKAGQSLTRASLLMESAPLLDAEVYRNGEQVGITVPVLIPDRYFTFDRSKLDSIYDRFGIPVKPKILPRSVDIAKTIKFSDLDLDTVKSSYGSFISSLIEDKEVKYGKNVEIDVNGNNTMGREVIVTLDGLKTKKLVQSITEKISNDDLLLGLTFGNFAGIVKLYDEAGLLQAVKALSDYGYIKLGANTKNMPASFDIQKSMENFKSAIKEFGAASSFPDGLGMTIVVDKSGNILDRKLSMAYAGTDGIKYKISLHSGTNDIKNDNFDNGFCDISVEYKNSGGNTLVNEVSVAANLVPGKGEGNKKGRVLVNYIGKKDGKQEFSARAVLDIDKNTDAKTLKDNNIVKYSIELLGSKPDSPDKLSGEINTVSWKNNKSKMNNINTLLTINADIPSLGMKNTSIKLDLKKENKLDAEFSLPEVDPATVTDIGSMTDKDMKKLMDDIYASFGEFYLQNQPLVDALTGK
jgi:hypothetical protein